MMIEFICATSIGLIEYMLTNMRRLCRNSVHKTVWLDELLRLSCVRTWHDTLKTLRRVSARTITHRRTKRDVISRWLSHGAFLGLQEDVDIVTTQKPFELDIESYWKLKRCFWEGCGCSTHKARHSLRACTRCWSVLYCNEKCQSL